MTYPATAEQAYAIQDALRQQVVLSGELPGLRYVAGIDAAYAATSDQVVGAAVVLDAATLAVVDSATAAGVAKFPYIPGLLAFREVPVVQAAIEKLSITPDLVVCDGQGRAHPRRFGLACHLGVLTGIPTIGVAKTPIADFVMPDDKRGAATDLLMDGEVVGRVLRTRAGVKPVFVSVGHKLGLDEACAITLSLCTKYRQPETTRQADQLSRRALAADSRI